MISIEFTNAELRKLWAWIEHHQNQPLDRDQENILAKVNGAVETVTPRRANRQP